MNLPWFRMYSEFSGDPVIQSLAFEDQRHFVMILCLKCNGLLDRKIPQSRRDSIIARALGLDINSADEAKRRLLEVNLIDKNWQPKAWDKRQFKSDNSTERTRKYRKNKEIGNVTESSQDSHGDAPEQNRTETEQKQKRSLPKDFQISDHVRDWAKKKGYNNLEGHFEHFTNAALAKGYKYINWDRAFMSAISADWAKLNNTSEDLGVYE